MVQKQPAPESQLSERTKSLVALFAGLMLSVGAVVSVIPTIGDLFKTTEGIGALMAATGGTLLTWVSRGYKALSR